MNEELRLLACPFCGENRASLCIGGYVRCYNEKCQAAGPDSEDGQDHAAAITAWNTRSAPQRHGREVTDADVERACEAYDQATDDQAANTADAVGMRAALLAALGGGEDGRG